jgi:glycosidase
LTVNREPVDDGVVEGAELRAEVALRAGSNEVQLIAGEARAARAETYTARARQGPTARISLSTVGSAVELDATASQPDPYTGAPITTFNWSERGGRALGAGARLRLTGPWSDGEHYVVVRIADTLGNVDEACAVFTVSGGAPASVQPDTWQAEWVQQAVVYGVIPPLFGAPPLQAVAAQLERLQALGVDTLWLSPIFETTPGEFGYAVTDYFQVRSDYGDLSDLQALVAAAHARAIKVILDMPLNDTSAHHPYFQQAKRYGQARSRYGDFYQRDASGRATFYFNWRDLPNLEYENAEVRLLATEAAAYWLREANVDGFRCDAAWGVQERRPGFWLEWQRELRRIKPDLLLIAEASAREGGWSADGFSAAYDWTEQLGEWAWKGAFSHRRVSLEQLSAALEAPTPSRPLRFLDNNDTGRRFIGRYGVGVTRAATALLLALPGLPCLYTGEEIGAEFLPYKRTRPLEWDSDPEAMESLFQRLIADRRAHPALVSGELRLATVAQSPPLLAFTATDASESLLLVVNFSAEPASATVSVPGATTPVSVQVGAFSIAQLQLS